MLMRTESRGRILLRFLLAALLFIARISPRDGHVIAWIDLKGLLPVEQSIDDEAVLNEFAYDARYHRIFVTGKRWPTVFQIEVVERPR